MADLTVDWTSGADAYSESFDTGDRDINGFEIASALANLGAKLQLEHSEDYVAGDGDPDGNATWVKVYDDANTAIAWTVGTAACCARFSPSSTMKLGRVRLKAVTAADADANQTTGSVGLNLVKIRV